MITNEEEMAKEQWSRVQQLSKKEMAERQVRFEHYQKQYNETHDAKILWTCLYPMFVDCCKSNILKINKHHFVINFEEKTDKAVDLLITRYLKKPQYNFKSLVTLCYWAAVWACRQKDIIQEDMEQSYEYLVDDMMLHEDEHIIDFETLAEYNYADVDELY